MRERLEWICPKRGPRPTLRDDERIRSCDSEVQRLSGRGVCDFIFERQTTGQKPHKHRRTSNIQVLAMSELSSLTTLQNVVNLCEYCLELTSSSRSFNFKDGDVLMFMDEGDNGVLHIASIAYQCGGLLLSESTHCAHANVCISPYIISICMRSLGRKATCVAKEKWSVNDCFCSS